jgi:hypothetical protein
MVQQSASQRYTDEHLKEKFARPKRFDVFFHAIKTFKLIGSLMTDGRVPVVRKFLFVGSIAALVIFLFFPDLLSEAFLSAVLPVVGTVLGVPLDAGFDWIAFALVVVSLLRYFPSDIVSEHYMRIFDK